MELNENIAIILSFAGPSLSSIFLFTHCLTSYGILVDKSVKTLSPIPFACAVVNCSAWLIYGWMTNQKPIYLPNAFGLSLATICLAVYEYYAVKRSSLVLLLCASIIAITLVYALQENKSMVGNICMTFSVLVSASPLSTISTVIRDKNTDSMPFSTSFTTLLACTSWTLYGLLVVDDFYIYGPNIIGLCFAVVQISVLLMYCNRNKGDSVLPVTIK